MSLDKTFDGSDAHLMPADAAACVAFLRGYQAWRRWIGAAPLAEEGPAMPHPNSIGFAIDMAIRLIEQRGELLAALEKAKEWISEIIKDGDHSGSDIPSEWQIFVDIKSAIAKATGEQS